MWYIDHRGQRQESSQRLDDRDVDLRCENPHGLKSSQLGHRCFVLVGATSGHGQPSSCSLHMVAEVVTIIIVVVTFMYSASCSLCNEKDGDLLKSFFSQIYWTANLFVMNTNNIDLEQFLLWLYSLLMSNIALRPNKFQNILCNSQWLVCNSLNPILGQSWIWE